MINSIWRNCTNILQIKKNINNTKGKKIKNRNGHSISKKVPYNQVINENTQQNYLELLLSPGWEGFNYRRPENINKLGILYTNLSLKKPVFFHFFYPISQFVIFINCLFLGLGMQSPGIQIIFSLVLHIFLLIFFCFSKMYKNMLIFIFTIILQILFLLVLLGPFMIYIDYMRDLTNSNGRERMGLYTIIMFLIFTLVALLISATWIIVRYCLPQKFKSTYYNRDFADETYLKYYKEIPKMVYKMGQKAESTENTNTNIGNYEDPYPQVNKPKSLINPPKIYNNTETKKFEVQITPTDTLKAKGNNLSPIKINDADFSEKKIDYLSDDDNEVNYNPNRSRAPNNFTDSSNRDKKIAKLTLKNLNNNPYYTKDNFQTTDRGITESITQTKKKPIDIQVKESELFQSNAYYYKATKPEDQLSDSENLRRQVEANAKVDNFHFLKNYEVNKTTRNQNGLKTELNNIENSNKMGYSYFQTAQRNTSTRNKIETNTRLRESGNEQKHIMEVGSNANKPFFTNENLTKIMGQDDHMDYGNGYSGQMVQPMKNLQLKHSQYLMNERFGMADDLK